MSKSGSIIYIDYSEIRDGKLQELKTAIQDLAELVEKNEPRIIAYNAYLSDEDHTMTVIQIHPDSASLEFHGKVAGPAFGKFVSLVKLKMIDVYGMPSESVMEQLQKKAKTLGDATVVVHKLHTGFIRPGVH